MRWAALLLFVALAVLAREILLLSFLAVLFAVFLNYPIAFLSRRLPRGLSVILVLLAMLGAMAGVVLIAVPKISRQVQSMAQRLPEAAGRVDDWVTRLKQQSPAAQSPTGQKIANRVSDRLTQSAAAAAGGLFPAAVSMISVVSAAVYVFVLAAFLAYQPRLYRKGLKSLVPARYEADFDEAYDRLGNGIRHWVGAILIAMTLMGSFAAIGLRLAGIDDWLFLGLLTFLGTFIPYIGAISSAVPGILVGLAQSPHHMLLACAVYLGVHVMEGYIIQPFVMKKAVELKPAVLLIGQAVLGGLLGIMGVIVAAPLLICGQILVQYFYIEKTLGKGATKAPLPVPRAA